MRLTEREIDKLLIFTAADVARFPDVQIVFLESGGDNLAASFSPELVDVSIYVVDVAGGDKVPRKGGPGVTRWPPKPARIGTTTVRWSPSRSPRPASCICARAGTMGRRSTACCGGQWNGWRALGGLPAVHMDRFRC